MFTTKRWKAEAVVEASPDKVFMAMLDSHMVNSKLPPDSYYFNVDHKHQTITVRGHYWYEGVFTVGVHPKGALVTYRVNNIGPQSHIMPKISKWMVPLWQYRLPKQMAESLAGTAAHIARKLKCKAYLVS